MARRPSSRAPTAGPSAGPTGASAEGRLTDDVARSWTLHASAWRDPERYRAQLEQAFARTWHWIDVAGGGPLADGDVRPVTLLPGALDEPLLVAREGGAEHLLSNVCTHRGAVLVEDARTECRHVTCPYHGRRFALDGRFEHMPEFDGAVAFPSPSDDLPRVPHARVGPLSFASVAPLCSFDEATAEVLERVRRLPLDDLRLDASRSRVYDLDAHWALYVDNYLEGFHVPYVHPDLGESIDYATYRTETFAWSSLQTAWAKPGEVAFEPELTPDDEPGVAGYYAWVFPATMLNFYPWGLSLNAVQPLGPARTRVVFQSWVARPELLDEGAGGALHRVELEDEAIVERVQRGVRSRFYRRGRFSPSREQAVHHFHRLLARAVGDG